MNIDRDPVIVCKFNQEIFIYLQSKDIPIVYIEDAYDAETYSQLIYEYSPIGIYRVDDINNLSALMVAAAQIKIDHPSALVVLSPNEFSQYAAAVLRAAIAGDASTFATTHCTRDKALMKAVLSASGVPIARGFSLSGGTADTTIARITNELRFPLILKPRSAMSSLGVHRITGPQDLPWVVSPLQADCKFDEYICEEYISGSEYFVDTIWKDGEPWVALIGKYDIPMLDVALGRGLGVARYISREEHPAVYDGIIDVNRRAAKACSVREGVTHAEFLVDMDNNVFLGEIATRMGGGPHEALAKLATGASLGEMQARAILGDLSLEPPQSMPMHQAVFGYINLQPPREGVVKEVLSESDALKLPGVVFVTKSRQPGERFDGLGSCNWFLCCIIQAPDRAGFERCQSILVEKFINTLKMD